MDEIIADPSTYYFRTPPNVDSLPGYRGMITNVQDLGSIRQRLREGKYSKISQWKDDVQTTWENGRTYNKDNQNTIAIISRCEKMFAKLCKKRLLITPAEISARIAKLTAKLEKSLSSAPTLAFPSLLPLHKTPPKRSSAERMNIFLESSRDDDMKREAYSLIRSIDDKIPLKTDSVTIDLSTLSEAALSALSDFIQMKIEGEK